MSASDNRPRARSSYEAGLRDKPPRIEGSDRRRDPDQQSALTFNTNDVSGSATINNVGGHIIQGDYVVQQINREKAEKVSTKEVHQWLAPPDNSGNYYAAREKHQAQTGSWFLDGPQYSAWKTTPDRPLRVAGDPGCGKTIICSSAIEDILLEYEQNQSVGVAYFFFDNRSGQSDFSMHEKMLRSMISQLSYQAVEIPAALLKIYDKGHQQPSVISLENALQSIIDGFEHAFMIIDALDECADRRKLLNWIKTISRWHGGKLHLMLSSRQEPDIEALFKLLDCLDIVKFGQHGGNADIQTYIEAKVATQDEWDDELRVIVKATLVEGAGGMFRWVDLQLEELISCLTRKDLEDRLLVLPKGLEEAYERMLLRSSRHADLKTFLQWMAFSTSPLTLSQMADTIAVDFAAKDGPVYDPKRRYMNVREVLTVCSGFVTEFQDTVRLAHMSVKDFLISTSIRSGAAADFSINERLSHLLICQTCLVFLLHLDTLESLKRITDNNLALARYAAEYWTTHFHGTMEISSVTLQTLIAKLYLSSSEPFRNSIRLHDPDTWRWLERTNLDRPSSDIPPRIYYAALAGLHSVAQTLIDLKRPLLQASRAGQYSTVRSLLAEGADVNWLIPRCATSKDGRLVVAKLLLEEQLTPLCAASYSGHHSIVNLLLKRGADVNAQGVEHGSSLHAASIKGHTTIARTLIRGGANINAKGGKHDTPLHAASSAGHLVIVEMLLVQGADINAAQLDGRTALHVASSRGNSGAVKMLLDLGADIDARESDGRTALNVASSRGHSEVVKMLLERGADINARESDSRTALHVASSRGHSGVVKMLLDRGADVHAQGWWHGTALRGASSGCHLVIMEMLLDRGADINARELDGRTTLHITSSEGHSEVVKMLLDRGADVLAKSPSGKTALKFARMFGHHAVVELLMRNGAEPKHHER